MRKQALVAGAIIVALIGIALVADEGILPSDTNFADDDAAGTPARASGQDGSLPDAFFREIDGGASMVDQYDSRLPEGFTDEVVDCSAFGEVLVADEGAVIGLVGKGDSSETFRSVSLELIEKGWVRVESDQETMGTFIKATGTYTWIMLSCSTAGDQVGTVIQVR